MSKKDFVIKQNSKKKRGELTLPSISYHQWETWRPVLEKACKGSWDAYLTLFTLADRRRYPDATVVHHFDYKGLAAKFLCGHQKAVKIIKTLYEFGLVDIHDHINEKKGPKNVLVVNDVPPGADSMYCELIKCRDWSDRNSIGQQRAKKAGMVSALKKSEESSVKITLDNQCENHTRKSEVSSVKITLDNQCENHTIYNNSNSNNMNDRMNEERETQIDENLDSENRTGAEDNTDLVSEVIEYYFGVIGPHRNIAPYIEAWVNAYGAETVVYVIDRLHEQEKVTNVVKWMEAAFKNPQKYPPKITYEKNDRKQMFDSLLMS